MECRHFEPRYDYQRSLEKARRRHDYHKKKALEIILSKYGISDGVVFGIDDEEPWIDHRKYQASNATSVVSGRPDLMIFTSDSNIFVIEVKTGKRPYSTSIPQYEVDQLSDYVRLISFIFNNRRVLEEGNRIIKSTYHNEEIILKLPNISKLLDKIDRSVLVNKNWSIKGILVKFVFDRGNRIVSTILVELTDSQQLGHLQDIQKIYESTSHGSMLYVVTRKCRLCRRMGEDCPIFSTG